MAGSSRRKFIVTGLAAGGLLVGYGLFKPRDLLGDKSLLRVRPGESALNAWLKIGADATVTIAVPRAEMGQGIYTGLAMLVAEELDCAWDQVRYEHAAPHKVYGNIEMFLAGVPFDERDNSIVANSTRWGFARFARYLGLNVTGGSSSMRDAWVPMRAAGAAARDMLLRAGAARMQVPPAACTTERGVVRHAASRREIDYGELAADAARLSPPRKFRYRAATDYRLIGRSVPRLDIPAKVDGSATYGIDVRPPGLLFAAVMSCPVAGGRIASVDTTDAQDLPGVVAVTRTDTAVIVIAASYWQAKTALATVRVEFDHGPNAQLTSGDIEERLSTALDSVSWTYEKKGDPAAVMATDGIQVTAEFKVPLLAHACMEPENCTALVTDTGCEVWSGNQAALLHRNIAAKLSGHDENNVTIHTTVMGGGFGRRFEPAVLEQTVRAALAVKGRPVQLIWSREEDIQRDSFRPPAMSRFTATLSADGRIKAWHHRIACPSVTKSAMRRVFPGVPAVGPDRTSVDGAVFLAYEMPNRIVEHSEVETALPVGYWRSVGHSFNAFFTECFMDELAHAAGQDPIAFRMAHLPAGSRHLNVLALLADKSDWDSTPAAGTGRGVALHESFKSIVAQVAECEIDADRHIRVSKVVCVIDCGRAVNPDSVVAQMESGIIFGMTAALHGRIDVADGRIVQANFPDYRMTYMRDAPVIETYIIDSGAELGGVGEPGTPPIAPAIANALFSLTGKRNRELPLKV